MANLSKLAFLSIFLLCIMMSCSSNSNDPAFLQKVEGRYLYSDDETLEVHSKENKLLLDWRGAKNIEPSKVGDETFYVKEMNAKIQFLTNPDDQKLYLVFVPKEKDEKIEYIHAKMGTDQKIPSQYLEEKNFKKALEGYLAIKDKDSLSPLLYYRNFDRKGRRYLEKDSLELAINIFKLNVALNPEVSDVYVRLGNTYLESKDTTNALTNYKKALKYNSGSNRLKRKIEKLQGKEVDKTN